MKKTPGTTNQAIGVILKAAQFAAYKHRYQERKGKDKEPYINHPIEVAHVLCAEGGVSDPEIIAAALLHDTIEDTETTYDELVEEFGRRIADVVDEVTDDKKVEKAVRKQLQIEKAGRLSAAAQQVKIADKICNLRDILANPPVKWTLERKQQYFDWAKLVVDEVRDANPALATRFDKLYAHWARKRAGRAKSPKSERKARSGDSRPAQLELDARRKKFEEVAKMIVGVLKKA